MIIEENFDEWYGEYNGFYSDLIEDQGEVLAQQDIGSYQGDFVFVLKAADGFGFGSVGYGSCAGCDALMACRSIEELKELQSSIVNSIKWFDSLEELKKYILNGFAGNNWYANDRGWTEFKQQVNNLPTSALAG